MAMEARRAVVRSDLDCCRQLIASWSAISEPSVQGWIDYIEGNIARINHEFAEAEFRFRRSHEHFLRLNDLGGLAFATNGLGWVARHHGRHEEGHMLCTEALDLATRAEFPHAQAAVHAAFATLYKEMRQFADARRHSNIAMALMDELGESFEFATIEVELAEILVNMEPLKSDAAEQHVVARRHYEHALSVFQESGSLERTATTLCQIGWLSLDVHDYNEALKFFHKGLATLNDAVQQNPSLHRLTSDIGVVYAMIAEIHVTARNLDTARAYIQKSLGILGPDSRYGPHLHSSLGIIAVWDGQPEVALGEYRLSLDALREQGDTHNIGHALLNIAHCQLWLGDVAGARISLEDSSSHARLDVHSATWRAVVTAKLLLAEVRPSEAHEAISSIMSTVEDETLKWERVEAEIVLRDIALAQGNLAEYVRHNDLVTKLTDELRGSKTQQSLALMEQEKEIEAERLRTQQERERERAVLYSALPKSVADRIIRGEDVSGDHVDNAAVIFLDIAGFTTASSQFEPGAVTGLLARVFTDFDALCARHGVTKIKTIGDSYMAVAFPTVEDLNVGGLEVEHRAAHIALEMIASNFTWPDGEPVVFRVGVHSGPVVAGVIGTDRLQYDVWGDTVNVASRMESTGEPGRIQVSESFARGLRAKDNGLPTDESNVNIAHSPYTLALRGETEIKGKGTMTTYWLERA